LLLDAALSARKTQTVPALFQPFPMLPGRQAHVWHHEPKFRRPRHFHEEPELNVVTRGTGIVSIGERELQLEAGNFVLLQPGQDHALLDESPDFELFVLALSPELAARVGVAGQRQVGKCRLEDSALSQFREASLAMNHLADTNAVEVHLARHFVAMSNEFAPSHTLCRRALLQLGGDMELSETQLAATLNTDPSGVSRHVRQGLGVRLVEYRARLRLMEFVKRVDGGRPLTRAALESGFGSYAQCHRVFQRSLGCSPSVYFSGERLRINAELLPSSPV
jgi:AraC-like DNA-binding protein/quercetin dioxygenase-like cupin family protein